MHYPNPANASSQPSAAADEKKSHPYRYVPTLDVPAAALPAIAPAVGPLSLAGDRTETEHTWRRYDRHRDRGGGLNSSPKPASSMRTRRPTTRRFNAPATLADGATSDGFPAAFGDPFQGTGPRYLRHLLLLQSRRPRICPGANHARHRLPRGQSVRRRLRRHQLSHARRRPLQTRPLATVCMDHSMLPTWARSHRRRYTRFYVYAGGGPSRIAPTSTAPAKVHPQSLRHLPRRN